MSIDLKKIIEQNCLILIRIELDELPEKLEKLVDKSYEFSTTEYNTLKNEQKDFYERLKKNQILLVWMRMEIIFLIMIIWNQMQMTILWKKGMLSKLIQQPCILC